MCRIDPVHQAPTVVVDVPTQGKSVKETPPVRQNRCLVSERVTEPVALSPHEHTPA